MIHTDEDDEFDRIARENALKGQPYHFTKHKDDDDIQDYVRPWVGLTDKEILADDVLRYHFGLNGGAGPVSKSGRKIVDALEAKLRSKNT